MYTAGGGYKIMLIKPTVEAFFYGLVFCSETGKARSYVGSTPTLIVANAGGK